MRQVAAALDSSRKAMKNPGTWDNRQEIESLLSEPSTSSNNEMVIVCFFLLGF